MLQLDLDAAKPSFVIENAYDFIWHLTTFTKKRRIAFKEETHQYKVFHMLSLVHFKLKTTKA
jgi:hypothetical protein